MEELYQLKAPQQELEVVGETVRYAKEYLEEWNQGPVWLTGSSLYSANPDDYDIVVQRSFQEVPVQADHRLAADILNEIEDENIDTDTDLNELIDQLEVSNKADTGRSVNLFPEPIRRFQLYLGDTKIDLSFNNKRPVDEAIELIE